MSSKREKRRRGSTSLPATGAGLLRFFEEDTPGIQVTPEAVVILTISLIAVCLIAGYFYV